MEKPPFQVSSGVDIQKKSGDFLELFKETFFSTFWPILFEF